MVKILLITGNLCESSLYKDYEILNIDILEWWKMKDFNLDNIYNIIIKYDIFILHSASCCLLAFIVSFYNIKKKMLIFSFDGHGLIDKYGVLFDCYQKIYINKQNKDCIDMVINNYENISEKNLKKITIFSKKYILNNLKKYKKELNESYKSFLDSIIKLYKIKKPKTNKKYIKWIQIQSTKTNYLTFKNNNYGNNKFLIKMKKMLDIDIIIDSYDDSEFQQHFNIIKYSSKYIPFIKYYIENN